MCNTLCLKNQGIYFNCCCLVAKLCLTLLWPHGLQPTRLLCPLDSPGKTLECVAIHFLLRGSSQPRDQTCDSSHFCIAGRFFFFLYCCHPGSPFVLTYIYILNSNTKHQNALQKIRGEKKERNLLFLLTMYTMPLRCQRKDCNYLLYKIWQFIDLADA